MKKAQLASKNLFKLKRIRKNKKNYFRGTVDKTETRPTYTHSSSPFDVRYIVLFALLLGVFLIYTPLTFLATKLPSLVNFSAIVQFVTHMHLPQLTIPAVHVKVPAIHVPIITLPSPAFLSPITRILTVFLGSFMQQQLLLWRYVAQFAETAVQFTLITSWRIGSASTIWLIDDLNPLPGFAELSSLVVLLYGISAATIYHLFQATSLSFPALLHATEAIGITLSHFCIAIAVSGYHIIASGITTIAKYIAALINSIGNAFGNLFTICESKTPQALSVAGQYLEWTLTNAASGTLWLGSVVRDYCLIVAHFVVVSSVWLWKMIVIASIITARIVVFLAIHEFQAREVFYTVLDYWVIQTGLFTWNITILCFAWIWFGITVVGDFIFFILLSIWHGITFVVMAIKHWLDGIFGAIGWFFYQLYPAYVFITTNIAQSVTSLFGDMGAIFSATIHH